MAESLSAFISKMIDVKGLLSALMIAVISLGGVTYQTSRDNAVAITHLAAVIDSRTQDQAALIKERTAGRITKAEVAQEFDNLRLFVGYELGILKAQVIENAKELKDRSAWMNNTADRLLRLELTHNKEQTKDNE